MLPSFEVPHPGIFSCPYPSPFCFSYKWEMDVYESVYLVRIIYIMLNSLNACSARHRLGALSAIVCEVQKYQLQRSEGHALLV